MHPMHDPSHPTARGRARTPRFQNAAGLFLATLAAACLQAELTPVDLRCEYLRRPHAIDTREPRLSWRLVSSRRAQVQTAYEILVAETLRSLEREQGDLWASGKVPSDETLHIVYAGKPLRSCQTAFWKVRVWDAEDRASDWSRPARWRMGLLEAGDWVAEWISTPASPLPDQAANNGFHSRLTGSPETTQAVTIDWGQIRAIDHVRLWPARPFDWQPDTPGFLFPLRFSMVVATNPAFADATMVVDRHDTDVLNPGTNALVLHFPPVPARGVRLEVTRLACRDTTNHAFALAELEVFQNSTNVARGARVESRDSLEQGAWSNRNLVDGICTSRPYTAGTRLPAPMLRKEFNVPAGIRQARLYASALGLYELRINGQRVGDQVLAPEWTDYHQRVQYQAYEVGSLLRPGTNTIAALLGDGWYAGRIGMAQSLRPDGRRWGIYGLKPWLLAQLEIETNTGQHLVFGTDNSWKTTIEGPIRSADILDGETIDARREMPGWDHAGFPDHGWLEAVTSRFDILRLVAQPNDPIRVTATLAAVNLSEPSPGVYVFDLGQNMVGWCRCRLAEPAGTRITFRHAEVLQPDGHLYTANLRGAPQTDVYFAKGGGEEVFDPRFTYHGFRYVEVTGLSRRPSRGDLVGCVVHSDATTASHFACSDSRLNRLMENIRWTLRGNLHSTMTDCPQRDERLGWLGDAQIISQTACFNLDLASFLTKWIRDIRDAQAEDGRFPDFAPHPFDPNQRFSGAPGWADAGVILPWRLYVNYGDRRFLEEHFASARRWVDFVHRENPDLIWRQHRGNSYNDWLNGDWLILENWPRGASVPPELMATACFAHSTHLVSRMAAVLGRRSEAEQYGSLAAAIRKAFADAFVTADGAVAGNTQSGYAFALHYDLLPEPLRPQALEHLGRLLDRFGWHPSTGIQATRPLMLALSENGHHDWAWRLAQQRSPPSWGYMLEQGATTIWERWDGYVAGRQHDRFPFGFQDPGMNSFNHFALGSVGEWIWCHVVGLNPDEARPAWKHLVIRPQTAPGLEWVQGRYDSPRGPIACAWRTHPDRLEVDIALPPGTTATVHLPATERESVTESGHRLEASEGVVLRSPSPPVVVLEIGSGSYRFAVLRQARDQE